MKAYQRFLQGAYRVYADGVPEPLSPQEAWRRLHVSEGTRLRHPVVFIRGLPGVGKTTLAKQVWPRRKCFAADDYASGGTLSMPIRHAYCKNAIAAYLEGGGRLVVTNTFTQRWEIQDYMAVTDCIIAVPFIIHLHHGVLTDSDLVRRCIHGVPQHVMQAMRARWEAWPGELLVTHGVLPEDVIQAFVAQWRPWPGPLEYYAMNMKLKRQRLPAPPPAPPVRVNRWVTRTSQPAIVPATAAPTRPPPRAVRIRRGNERFLDQQEKEEQR